MNDRFSLGVLGRSDRGYHFGTLDLVRATGDSTFTQVTGNNHQQWFGGGLEGRWSPRTNVTVEGEFLAGVHRP